MTPPTPRLRLSKGLHRPGSEDRSGEPSSRHRHRLALEPLEDRILLSADPLLLAALPNDGAVDADPVVVVLEMGEAPDAGDALARPEANGAEAVSDEAGAEAPRLVWPEAVVDDASGPIEWTEVGDPAASGETVSQESLAAEPSAPSEEVVLVLRAGTGADASGAAPGDPGEAAPSAPPTESLARGPPFPGSLATLSNALLNDAGALWALQPRDVPARVLSYGRLAASLDVRTWEGTSLEGTSNQALHAATLELADLPGDLLARRDGAPIAADSAASDVAWFVDPSDQDAERAFADLDTADAPDRSAADPSATRRAHLLVALLEQVRQAIGAESTAEQGGDREGSGELLAVGTVAPLLGAAPSRAGSQREPEDLPEGAGSTPESGAAPTPETGAADPAAGAVVLASDPANALERVGAGQTVAGSEIPGAAADPRAAEVPGDSLARAPPTEEPDRLVSATVATGGTPLALTNAELQLLVAESGFERWIDAGYLTGAAASSFLSGLTFQIDDLPGATLGETSGSTIAIDTTAAGHGWFVDPSPDDDAEFGATPPAGMDLLTVVLHELGHAFGLEHVPGDGLLMSGSLAPGQRLLPAQTLNQVIDALLAAEFDPVANPDPFGSFVFTTAHPAVPTFVTIGETVGGGPDLEIQNPTLTFSELHYDATGGFWTGEVAVNAPFAVLFPGKLDVGIVDDGLDAPRRVTSVLELGSGRYQFRLAGDHSDIGDGDEIAVLNSRQPGFDDADLDDDSRQILAVGDAAFDSSSNSTALTVEYDFDPGAGGWIGGSLVALSDADLDDDADLNAVGGTLQLAPGNPQSLLLFDNLEAADIGWPRFLAIRIENLQMEFTDFRGDESSSTLELDARFLGFDTGIAPLNALIGAILTVSGSATGVEIDLDRLAEASLDLGFVRIPKNPIVDLGGISGEIGGNIFGVGEIAAGFIAKKIGIDANGMATTQDSQTVESVVYFAVRGEFSLAGTKVPDPDHPGRFKIEGGIDLGFNFAVSELGPLSVFLYTDVQIILDPISGLSITELRGGLRFNATLPDLQVRPPLGATGGGAEATGDLLNPVEITLTLPGHNLVPGDEIRVINAADADLLGDFVVSAVDGDEVSYRTTGNPGDYVFATPIEVRKLSISAPEDLRDPGFQSSQDLSLQEWETQLDQQVVNQANAGDSFWEVLFDDVVIEAGATVSFKPRIPEFVLRLEVDLLLDTDLRLLLTGTMVNLTVLKIPVRLFADLSEVGSGALSFLLLGDLPEIPENTAGILPLLVLRARVTFETLVGGVPASLDALTGFPSGVGFDVTAASVADLASPGTGPGPWDVTLTLELPAGVLASQEFAVGDELVVVASEPATFDGSFRVTAVDDAAGSVTVRLGASILDGGIDLNLDGLIDAADVGVIGGLPVIGGRIDRNRDDEVNADDDGEVFTVLRDSAGNRIVVGYALIDGFVDVDGDGNALADPDDDGVLGEDPGSWVSGSRVANEDDLGDGFRINIDGGIDLNIPFVTTLTLEGAATLDVTLPGPGVPEDVRLDLALEMALRETTVGNIGLANGALHLTFDADILDDEGGLQLPHVELWGAALLDTDFAFLEPIGLFASAQGVLRINSTDEVKPSEILRDANGDLVEVALPASSFALRLDGSVGFRIDFDGNGAFATNEGVFLIEGAFALEFSADQGFNVAIFRDAGGTLGPATLSVGPAGSPFLQFDVFGFMAVRPIGFAANMILSLDASLPGALASLASIDGQFVFMVNTTAMDLSFSVPGQFRSPSGGSDLLVHMPRAPPTSITDVSLDVFALIAGNAWTLPAIADGGPLGGPYVLIHLGGTDPATDPDASLVVGPFSLNGKFSFLLGVTLQQDGSLDPLLEITAQYSLEIAVGSTRLLALEGDGFLRFDQSGLVAKLTMGLQAGFSLPSSVGFDLQVSFELQLNTTGAVAQGIAPGFRLHMAGNLDVLGALTIQGTFDLTIQSNVVSLAITGHFDLLGVRADLVASAVIQSNGFALSATLTLGTGGALAVVPGLFNVQGSFNLTLSTITGDAFISIVGAQVNLMGLVMSGDLTIGVRGGQFFIHVPGDHPLTLSFFGVATLKVSGSFNYNPVTDTVGGNAFRFTASAELRIGIQGFLGVAGTLSVTFDSSQGSFTGSVSGTAWIFGFSLSASASLTVRGSAISLSLSVTVTIIPSFKIWIPFVGTVTVPAVTATFRHTFNVGSVTPPAEITVPNPDPPVLARLVGSELFLNLGVDRSLRDPGGDWDDEDPSEGFRVTHLSGVQGDETVRVDAFGFQQDYAGVARIVVTDAGDGEDVIEIGVGVLADAEIHGGGGADRLVYLGSGVALLEGGEGNDLLMSGSGGSAARPNRLEGGAGDDRLEPGSGFSDLFGEAGNDTIVWTLGSAAQLGTIDGGSDLGDAQRDTLLIVGTSSGDSFGVSAAAGGGFTITTSAGAASASLVERLIVDASGGGDAITVNDLAASSLAQLTFRMGLDASGSDDDGAQDSVVVRGGSGGEAFTLVEFEGTTVSVDVGGSWSVSIEDGDAKGGDRSIGDRLHVIGNGGGDSVDATALSNLLVNLSFELGADALGFLGSTFADRIEITVSGDTTGVFQVDGLGGDDTYVVQLLGGSTNAAISISDTGTGGADAVVVSGTSGVERIELTSSVFRQGANTEILSYSGLESFTIYTLGDADEVVILGTHAGQVSVDSGDGDDAIAVRGVSGPTTIQTGDGSDRVNVGSNAGILSNSGGSLNGIAASLTLDLEGGGGDVLDLDDGADLAANVGIELTATGLTGLGTASGIAYAGVEDLRIHLGSGADELLLLATHAGATRIDGNGGADRVAVRTIAGATTIHTQAGSDRVDVGSNAAPGSNAGGTVNGIGALLTVDLGPADTDVLDLDDSADLAANLGIQLAATQLTGLGTASGIAYAGAEDLRIQLGSGADELLVLATHAGATRIDGNGGADRVAVRTISGATTIHTQEGSDRVNVGSNASPGSNAGGTANGIGALLTVDLGPADTDVLDLDDSADLAANVGIELTATGLTGLGTASGIAYAGVEDLRIHLGSGSDELLLLATHAGATRIDGNGGADRVAVRTIAGATTIHTQAGSDRVDVGSNAAPGSNAGGTVNGIGALLTVDLGPADADVLDVDDSADAAANVGIELTATGLTGLGTASGIAYAGVEDLRIHLGSGADELLLLATHAGATRIDGNDGADSIDVRSIAGPTDLFTGAGADTVRVGSLAPAPSSVLDAIGDGAGDRLRVDGGTDGDTDRLLVDDSGEVADPASALVVTPTALAGLGMAEPLEYLRIDELVVTLGALRDDVTVLGTHAGSTQLASGGGDDVFDVRSIQGPTVVATGLGANTVHVGSAGPGAAGLLDALAARLEVRGEGALDSLILDDTGDATSNDGTLTGSLLLGLGSAGIAYSGIEQLHVDLGSGDDRMSVQGTSGETHLDTNGGDDLIFVSSDADASALDGAAAAGDLAAVHALALHGSLDGILAPLRIEAGSGQNALAVSDRDDPDPDADAVLSAGSIVGLAPAEISYAATGGDFSGQGRYATAADLGLFGRGISVYGGSGGNAFSVRGLFASGLAGVVPFERTLSTLFAGEGADRVDVSVGDAPGVLLVVHGQGGADVIDASVASLPLVIFGDGGADEIRGGSAADLLLGDSGQLRYALPPGSPVGFDIVLGVPAPGGLPAPDGDFRTADLVLSIAGAGDGADGVRGDAGDDVILGGGLGDRLDGGAGEDLVFGDHVRLERSAGSGDALEPRFRKLTGSTIYDAQGNPQVGAPQPRPGGSAPAWVDWSIDLLDDSAAIPSSSYGGDSIAGGAGDDQLFGQQGDDAIQGDGSIDLEVRETGRSAEDLAGIGADGDDYVEGGGGNDLVFGNLGQDDLVGGSSGLFGLAEAGARSDGSDVIFGGAGTRVARNDPGDTSPEGHARDADVILGDNGNIFRILTGGGAYERFVYDESFGSPGDPRFEGRGSLRIVPRAAGWLDYTPGGADFDAARQAGDQGAADVLHGEAGDDAVYGMLGADVLFGEGQDDDLAGGYGHDWISGGTGRDGILGDDGRIATSRVDTRAEPLHGAAAFTAAELGATISSPHHSAVINVRGELKKTADLEPFGVSPAGAADTLFDPADADDVLYGGLGGDWIHGGSGDDALSGAEASPGYYAEPRSAEGALAFDPAEGPVDPRSPDGRATDGDDRLFGDHGNDWLVGGTGRDHMYGGWGDDLLDADDDPASTLVPDPDPGYEDIAFGGAGRDVLVANARGDRLIDWTGQFNRYVVPFSSSGAPTIVHAAQPKVVQFLYDLSKSDGADGTIGAPGDPRRGEPFGELGLVTSKDAAWQDQHGGPADPQPGSAASAFDLRVASTPATPATGPFAVTSGTLPAILGPVPGDADGDGVVGAADLLLVGRHFGSRGELAADLDGNAAVGASDLVLAAARFGTSRDLAASGLFEIALDVRTQAGKPVAGSFLAAEVGGVVFDYHGPDRFKFAALRQDTDEVVVGHYTRDGGFEIDASTHWSVDPGDRPRLSIWLTETAVRVRVDGEAVLGHSFGTSVDDGVVGLLALDGLRRFEAFTAESLPDG